MVLAAKVYHFGWRNRDKVQTFNLLLICDHVCINGPLVGRYETEISTVKVNWSILVGFREICQSGSLLHEEAVDSHFKLISKLKRSRNWYFSEQISQISVIFAFPSAASKMLSDIAKKKDFI